MDEEIYYITSESSSGDKRFITVLEFSLEVTYTVTNHAGYYDFSSVLENDNNPKQEVIPIPVFLWLISYSPQFQFQENWLKLVYQNLDIKCLPEYLLNKSKSIRTESDISKPVTPTESDFPKMLRDFSLEKMLTLLLELQSDYSQSDNLIKLLKSKSSWKPSDNPDDAGSGNALLNFVTLDHKMFKDQLFYVSSNLSSYLTDSITKHNGYERNTRSMPMKWESLQNLNLNFPLIPDNHNYYKIFDFLTPNVIIHFFYGILLEERILLISENVAKITAVIEAMFELIFPFNPINYRTISILPESMLDFLGLPWPFVIGCTHEVFRKIEKINLHEHSAELMWLDIDHEKCWWERKVEYPQPHTQYFHNTLKFLKQMSPKQLNKLMKSQSVASPEEEQLFSIKKYIGDNLQIKQAFVNCILMLLNNFLAYETFKFTDDSKWNSCWSRFR